MKPKINILKEIKDKGLKVSFIIDKLPISRRTFYKKCKEMSWDASEIKILKDLNVV